MRNTPSIESSNSDCDAILDKLDNTIVSLENCLNSIVDERKTKMNVVGSLFKFGTSFTKLTFGVVGCAVKNTPKAVVAVAAAKREVVAEIEKGWNEHQKQEQIDALNQKIKSLKFK